MSCPHNKDNCPGEDFRFYQAPGLESSTLVIQVTGYLVEYAGWPAVKNVTLTSRRTSHTRDELPDFLTSLGLNTALNSGSSFGKNGEPCSEEKTPYRFNGDGSLTVISDRPSYNVVVERTYDIEADPQMQQWQAVSMVKLPVGGQLTVIYTPDSDKDKAFYRMRVVTPTT